MVAETEEDSAEKCPDAGQEDQGGSETKSAEKADGWIEKTGKAPAMLRLCVREFSSHSLKQVGVSCWTLYLIEFYQAQLGLAFSSSLQPFCPH